jgi:hypothetical protein
VLGLLLGALDLLARELGGSAKPQEDNEKE